MQKDLLPFSGEIAAYLAEVNRWSTLEAANRPSTVSAVHIVIRPLSTLLGGIFRGHGLLRAAMESISVLALTAKVWEYQMRVREGSGFLPPTSESQMNQFRR